MSVAQRTMSTSHGEIALCESGGSGLPILLLHGLGATKEVFARQFESPLADLHRMVAFDLPGHGASSRSANPETQYTIPAVAGLAASVLENLGIGRAVVFGWSLGGHIAIEMMNLRPDLMAGVMLTGAPPFGQGTIAALRAFHVSWDILLASKETYSRKDAERFARLCFGDDASEEQVASILAADGRMRSVVNKSLMRGDTADQKRVVEMSDIPIAMVNGTEEPIARLGHIAGLNYRNLWEHHTHVVADAGHSPFLTSPHAFNALLHRFMIHVALREREAPRHQVQREIARSA